MDKLEQKHEDLGGLVTSSKMLHSFVIQSFQQSHRLLLFKLVSAPHRDSTLFREDVGKVTTELPESCNINIILIKHHKLRRLFQYHEELVYTIMICASVSYAESL